MLLNEVSCENINAIIDTLKFRNKSKVFFVLKQLTGLNYCETDKNRGVESSKKMATDKKDTLSLPDTNDALTVLPEAVQDDYTASIELSNACREFYRNRVKATENFKQNIGNNKATTYRRTSIDDAMEKLRNEMVRYELIANFTNFYFIYMYFLSLCLVFRLPF